MKQDNNARNQACILGSFAAVFFFGTCLFAQDVYSPEVLCIIPWGDELGTLDDRWNFQPPSADDIWWAAGKWLVSDADELIILDRGEQNGLLKFAANGALLAHTDMVAIDLRAWPDAFSVSSTGEVLLALYDQLRLLSPSLTLLRTGQLPDAQARVVEIYPTDHGSFWIVYVPGPYSRQYFLLEYFTDGTMSTPLLLFDGIDFDNCNPCQPYTVVSPDGSTHHNYVDAYGFEYRVYLEEDGNHLRKVDPGGETVYTLTLSSDPGWTGYEALSDSTNYFFTWSGDFYTLRATDDGAVLTKYTLVTNHDPCCDLVVITSMPASGIGQVAVEFDASASYDPDPGDTLSFAWDFDGDNVFGEPVHDSYTGDPDNPTHTYYISYTGPVHVKVTDGHDGESICTVTVQVTVNEEN